MKLLSAIFFVLISMSLNARMCVMQGVDYVIETRTGITEGESVNGWFRLYKSGWVEQGGQIDSASPNQTITFFIPMQNAQYSVNVIAMMDVVSAPGEGNEGVRWRGTESMRVRTSSQLNHIPIMWEIKGMSE